MARLVGVSAVLTLLVLGPLLAVAVLGFDDIGYAGIFGRRPHREGGLPLDLLIVTVATVIATKVALGALKPVGRYFAKGEDLPPARDPGLL